MSISTPLSNRHWTVYIIADIYDTFYDTRPYCWFYLIHDLCRGLYLLKMMVFLTAIIMQPQLLF